MGLQESQDVSGFLLTIVNSDKGLRRGRNSKNYSNIAVDPSVLCATSVGPR